MDISLRYGPCMHVLVANDGNDDDLATWSITSDNAIFPRAPKLSCWYKLSTATTKILLQGCDFISE